MKERNDKIENNYPYTIADNKDDNGKIPSGFFLQKVRRKNGT